MSMPVTPNVKTSFRPASRQMLDWVADVIGQIRKALKHIESFAQGFAARWTDWPSRTRALLSAHGRLIGIIVKSHMILKSVRSCLSQKCRGR